MKTDFTHLHVHSHYSLLDGLSKIPDLIDRVKELGMDSVALTDHGVLYGAVEFYKEAKKKGVKPIIGCEVYVAHESMHLKRPNIDKRMYHLILLAKNKKGYQNLVKLVSKAHLEGFYYKPRIDDELLAKHSEGLICSTACLGGEIPKMIMSGRKDKALQKAKYYQKLFGKDNFYLEIQDNPNIPEQQMVNKALISMSREHNIPIIATNDAHYLRPEDAEAQDILMLINTGSDKNDSERLTMIADDFSITPPEQMAEAFSHVPEAISNTQKIKDMCNLEFDLGKIILPSFTPPEGSPSNEDYLEKLCRKNIERRYGSSPPPELEERLQEELSVINGMGFTDYFLITQDFVRWAKEQDIAVGPGRGSAGGSVVSYLLDIIDIDPIKYNLLFERFLNKARVSMPDIDLDFADTRRDEVIEYVRDKYGREKVAQIITFGTMAARGVIRDVGRALDYSYSYCDQIAKMIPFGFSLDKALKKVPELRQLYNREEKAKRLIEFGKKLEGVARHTSTHACAVVISHGRLDEITPLQHSSRDDETVITQYEMHACEDIGLLKMDFLGLKNLTIIEKTIKLVKAVRNKKIDLSAIPLDDKKTFDLLQKGQTTSVFQLESGGMKRYLKLLKPSEFEDIIAMVALYRPGPIELIPNYIKRKHGKEEVEYLHPDLEPILKETYAIMIYQEQLMQMARTMAGFTLSEADILRKAIGKKIISLLNKQEEKFKQGVLDNGYTQRIADSLWELILPFARYGFNRSHAAAYAMIAYETAYLKAHYPVEFMAAVFASERTDIERTSLLIEECRSMGIEVLPPDINESFANFTVVDEETIRFGLESIKNVGGSAVSDIVQERKDNGKFKSIADFVTRVDSKTLNKKTMESLIQAGTFDALESRGRLLTNLSLLLSWGRRHQSQKANGQNSLFSSNGQAEPKIRLDDAPDIDDRQKLKWEKELLGLYITSHPLERYKDQLKKETYPIAEIGHYIGRGIKVGGVVSRVKKITTKNGNPMLFASMEDQTGQIEVVVFPRIYQQSSSKWNEGNILLVTGKVDDKDGTPKLIAQSVKQLGI